ncbi:MAG TPA: hypothetical protein VIV07_02235 [Sphingomicrobium sp.]
MSARALPLLLLVALVPGCSDKPGEWSLFVYADARDRAHWSRTDRFQSEAMCRRAGAEALARLPQPRKASFECVHTGAPQD